MAARAYHEDDAVRLNELTVALNGARGLSNRCHFDGNPRTIFVVERRDGKRDHCCPFIGASKKHATEWAAQKLVKDCVVVNRYIARYCHCGRLNLLERIP